MKWISVEERLPEEGQQVVGLIEDEVFTTGRLYSRWDEVTHWMPLPQPPGSDEVEDDMPKELQDLNYMIGKACQSLTALIQVRSEMVSNLSSVQDQEEP